MSWSLRAAPAIGPLKPRWKPARRKSSGGWDAMQARSCGRELYFDIPLGVDLPGEESLNREQARALLQLPQSSFCVLFIGRLTQGYKADLDVLLGAVGRLAASGHEVNLILAGQSPNPGYIAYLRAHLTALHLTGRALILENFPEFLKSSILAACDVFVSPVDSIQETFGIAVVEAMAHARPVVATSWSGYRDLVVDGETGFLLKTRWPEEAAHFVSAFAPILNPIELADYLAQRTVLDVDELVSRLQFLAQNREAARAMGRNARQRVEAIFSWPQVAKQYLALWADQLDQARRVQPRERPSMDHSDFFSHYADETLSPNDMLVTSVARWNEHNIGDFWRFAGARQVIEIRDLIQFTRLGPARVADLLDQGYSLDCILWLAKKGICRIVSPNASGETAASARGAGS